MASEPLSESSWKSRPGSGSATPGGSSSSSWTLNANTPPGRSRPRRTRSQATNRSAGRWVKSEVTKMASKRSAQANSSGRTVETTPCTPKRSAWKRTPSA